METKIKFSFVENLGDFFHEDLIMTIPTLNKEYVFDSYYLILGKNVESKFDTAIIINNYLTRCKNAILNQAKNEVIYLPIEFSDEYFGVFKITSVDVDNFRLEYGYVRKTANVSLVMKSDFFQIDAKEIDCEFEIILNQGEIINSFRLIS